MPASNTYKVLWNDAYLKSFAAELNQPACSHVFWEIDANDELVDFKLAQHPQDDALLLPCSWGS